jgi:hypothetical protein
MSDVWNTYRTRFLVQAKQLTEPLIFTDVLGREHSGAVGDYLVQSSHGLRVAPREIFEDVYVVFERQENALPDDPPALPNPESLTI